MTERKVTFTIRVDEAKIVEKYPNYRFNWDNAEDFISSRIEDFETSTLERYGYEIIKDY